MQQYAHLHHSRHRINHRELIVGDVPAKELSVKRARLLEIAAADFKADDGTRHTLTLS
jgi:hypothetical protein